MNLVVDVGNTLVKLAIFENHKMLVDQSVDADSFLEKVNSKILPIFTREPKGHGKQSYR